MRHFKLLLISTLIILCHDVYALDSEHKLWEKIPIHIDLPIGQERLVTFPKNIKLIDEELSPSLSVLKVKGSLYLKAEKPFDHSRLIVQLIPNGEVILLNLKSNSSFKNNTPIEIITETSQSSSPNKSSHHDFNAIQLTRFSIQSLFSPERVREVPDGVYRSAMQTQRTVPLFYGASIEAHPIASWRGGHLYITAIELKNLLNRKIRLSPKQLIGAWQTATFYPKSFLPSRKKHGTTTVFLVSDEPFQKALNKHVRFSR